MAPMRRFSTAEKGKAPRGEPDPLPPKKRLAPRGPDEGALQVVSRPWCERVPAGVLPRGRWPGPCCDEYSARHPLPWRLLRRWRRRRFQRLRRALRDSGDERRQLRAPEPAPLLEQGGLVRPPPTLIWMGLASVLDGPLLMMASFAGTRVVCVPLGSVPCEESKMRPVGACKVHVILFC